MVASVSVRGAEKLQIVARALREAGDKDLQREFYRGLNRAVKPLREEVKDPQMLGQYLPDRYARVLAKDLRINARRRAFGRNPALYLIGTAKGRGGKTRDVRSLNRGRLRHPLFGNRGFWYNQRIKPHWWDHPLLLGAPAVRKELVRVLDDVGKKIARKVS